MGEFISIEIDTEKCSGIEKCGACLKVCPVRVFHSEGASPCVVESNEDECILCDLCIQSCAPGAITIHKLYEA